MEICASNATPKLGLSITNALKVRLIRLDLTALMRCVSFSTRIMNQQMAIGGIMTNIELSLMNFGIMPIPLLPEVYPNGKLVVPKTRCSPRVSRAKCQICPTEFLRKGRQVYCEDCRDKINKAKWRAASLSKTAKRRALR